MSGFLLRRRCGGFLAIVSPQQFLLDLDCHVLREKLQPFHGIERECLIPSPITATWLMHWDMPASRSRRTYSPGALASPASALAEQAQQPCRARGFLSRALLIGSQAHSKPSQKLNHPHLRNHQLYQSHWKSFQKQWLKTWSLISLLVEIQD